MGVVRSVGKGVAWNTISVLIGKALVFANVFLIFKYLSVYEYGLTELTMSVFSMASIVFLPGIVSTITTDMAVERSKGNMGAVKAIFWGYLRASYAFAIPAFVVFFLGSSLVAHYTGNDLIDSYIKIVSFLFFISPLRVANTSLAVITVRFVDSAVYSLIEETFKLIFLLTFLIGFEMHATGLLYAVVLCQLFAVLTFLPRSISAYRSFGPAPAHARESLWSLIMGHRKWSLAASTLGTINQNMYVWLVKFFLGTEAVGLYSAASGIMANLSGLLPMSPVLNSLAPTYAGRPNDLARLLRSSIKLQTAIAIGLVCAGFAFGPLFGFLFPKYQAALPLFYLMVISIIPTGITNTFNPIFAIYREQKSLLQSAVIKFCITFLIAPVAFIVFGLHGIAFENIIKNTLSMLERMRRLKTVLPEFSMRMYDVFIPDALEMSMARDLLQRIQGSFRFFRGR